MKQARLVSIVFAGLLAATAVYPQSTPPAPGPVKPAAGATATASPDVVMDGARVAWRFGEHFFRSRTGLVSPLPFYDNATVWDMASSLAMLYCARELGFLDDATYRRRMARALNTLATLKLFDGAAFNKVYQISTGAMINRAHKPSTRGYGWSVTDLGRLLIWLRIVGERDSELMPAAEQVARRLDYSRIVKDGYLWGEELMSNGTRRVYQEGQIGYEQYAAHGFALWGMPPEYALRLSENQIPVEVMGQTVAADKRQRDRLTSEPFVLAGLEFGWSADIERLARAVLATQEERARRTGILTMVSEDAVDVAPHYFYYYCVLANGREFSLDVQEPRAVVDKPRWLSTKAAFGWHALLPSPYTARVLQSLERARGPQGWSSGVYETSLASTETPNVNTAAVVMTAAVYAQRRAPLLPRRTATTAPH